MQVDGATENSNRKYSIMPRNAPADWMPWTADHDNLQKYRSLNDDSRKKLLEQITPGVALYSLPTRYFILDTENQKLLYLVELKLSHINGMSTISQMKVWRDYSASETKGIAERVFFDYIAPRADLVVTDGEQTPDGKRFWMLRIAEAYRRGLPVYLFDYNDKRIVQAMTFQEFHAMVPAFYGSSQKYSSKRIAIGAKVS